MISSMRSCVVQFWRRSKRRPANGRAVHLTPAGQHRGRRRRREKGGLPAAQADIAAVRRNRHLTIQAQQHLWAN